MSTPIRNARGTAAQWAASTRILGLGEVGLETDTLRSKFGDGVSTWPALDYYVDPPAAAAEVVDRAAADAAEAVTRGAADVAEATLRTAGDLAQSDLNSIGIIGDSIVANGHSAADTISSLGTAGFLAWAQVFLGQPFYVLPNVGVVAIGGYKLSDLLALPAWTTLLAAKPRWIVNAAGTNDLAASVSSSALIALFRTFVESVRAVGSTPVVCTILPRSGANVLDATKKATRIAVNNWLRDVPRLYPGAICVDWDRQFTTGFDSDADGTHFIDGLHPNPVGARLMGRSFADVFTSLVTPQPGALTESNTDASNLLANGLFAGNNGAGLATPGWTQVTVPPAHTTTKVARTDGPGEWQRVAITAAGELRLRQSIPATVFDTTKRYVAEVAYRNAAFTALTRFELLTLFSDAAGYYFVNYLTNYPDPATFPASGVLRTTPVRPTVTPGTLSFNLYLNFVGAVEITQARVRAISV